MPLGILCNGRYCGPCRFSLCRTTVALHFMTDPRPGNKNMLVALSCCRTTERGEIQISQPQANSVALDDMASVTIARHGGTSFHDQTFGCRRPSGFLLVNIIWVEVLWPLAWMKVVGCTSLWMRLTCLAFKTNYY